MDPGFGPLDQSPANGILSSLLVSNYMRVDDEPDNYWFHVLVREWGQLCIFMYIG